MLPLDHGELIHRQPVIRLHVGEIQQTHPIPRDRAISPAILYGHPVTQMMVKGAIVSDQRGGLVTEDLPKSLFPRLLGDGGIQAMDRFTETPLQHHIGEGIPLGSRLPRSHLGTMADGIAQLTEPL